MSANLGRPRVYPEVLTLDWIKTKCQVDETTGCWLWLGTLQGTGCRARPSAGPTHGYVHRRALELRLQRPLQLNACHTCDNILCVNPEHLYETTQQQNTYDVAQRAPRNDYCRKLTVEQVLAIRAEHAKGKITMTALAKQYKVGVPNIHAIITRRSWGHV